MSLYLCSLALYAGMSPTANIGIDTWPHKSGGYQFLHGLDAGMGEVDLKTVCYHGRGTMGRCVPVEVSQ